MSKYKFVLPKGSHVKMPDFRPKVCTVAHSWACKEILLPSRSFRDSRRRWQCGELYRSQFRYAACENCSSQKYGYRDSILTHIDTAVLTAVVYVDLGIFNS